MMTDAKVRPGTRSAAMSESPPATTYETLADVLRRVGDIAPQRIRLQPPPGHATEGDLLRVMDRNGRLYELVDGVLVEKVMAYLESVIAIELAFLLKLFLASHPLGVLAGPDGAI